MSIHVVVLVVAVAGRIGWWLVEGKLEGCFQYGGAIVAVYIPGLNHPANVGISWDLWIRARGRIM